MTTTAYLEIRSQPARGTWPRQGPDKYVAVQFVPDGVEKLVSLNRGVAAKRGIEIRIVGEGYSASTGPKSALGIAILRASKIVASHNS